MAKEEKKENAPMSKLERMRLAADRINKRLTKDLDSKDISSVYVVGDKSVIEFEGWSCGVPVVDNAFGGKIPLGKIIEIFGEESSGKTTLCHHIEVGFQKAFPEKGIAFIDVEYSLDTQYAKKVGVDNDGILILQPSNGIQALQGAVALAEDEGADIGLIIIDSVAALTTKSDDSGVIGDTTVAEQARMVSQALRKLNSVCGSRGITLIITNQLREKIGIAYGDNTTTPSGKALKYYASIRVRLRNGEKIKDSKEEVIGRRVNLCCEKNKVAPPFRKASYVITFGIGIDAVIAVQEASIKLGIIKKKGAWLTLPDGKLVQGEANYLDMLRKDKVLFEQIETLVKNSGVDLTEIDEETMQEVTNSDKDTEVVPE